MRLNESIGTNFKSKFSFKSFSTLFPRRLFLNRQPLCQKRFKNLSRAREVKIFSELFSINCLWSHRTPLVSRPLHEEIERFLSRIGGRHQCDHIKRNFDTWSFLEPGNCFPRFVWNNAKFGANFFSF